MSGDPVSPLADDDLSGYIDRVVRAKIAACEHTARLVGPGRELHDAIYAACLQLALREVTREAIARGWRPLPC